MSLLKIELFHPLPVSIPVFPFSPTKLSLIIEWFKLSKTIPLPILHDTLLFINSINVES